MTLVVLIGPSGVGKTTVGDLLISHLPQASWVRSYTTRQRREGEGPHSGRVFLTSAEFDELERTSTFSWVTENYSNRYGTSREDIAVSTVIDSAIFLLDFSPMYRHLLDSLEGKIRMVLMLPPTVDALVERLHRQGRSSRRGEALSSYECALASLPEFEEMTSAKVAIVEDAAMTARTLVDFLKEG